MLNSILSLKDLSNFFAPPVINIQCNRDKQWHFFSRYSCVCMCAKLLQLWPTLCDPRDYSLPGSSILGILQARTLEWVAIRFHSGSFQPRGGSDVQLLHWQAGSLALVPPGKAKVFILLTTCRKGKVREMTKIQTWAMMEKKFD